MEAILNIVKDVRLNTKVVSLTRSKDPYTKEFQSITVHDSKGGTANYDHIIFACHPDQAMKILGPEASEREAEILGGIQYIKNRAVLHRDRSVSFWKCFVPSIMRLYPIANAKALPFDFN